MSNKFSVPRIFDAGGRLNVRWYVEFTVVYTNGNRKRYRYMDGINTHNTVAERMRAEIALKKKLFLKLNAGWLPDNDNSINQCKYITFGEFVEKLVQYKKSYLKKTALSH